jgi:hypothetical protein
VSQAATVVDAAPQIQRNVAALAHQGDLQEARKTIQAVYEAQQGAKPPSTPVIDGDEPPMRTTVGFWMAALVLASLLSACAAGWPPPPTVSECVFIPRCRNPALSIGGD